jgi:microcystin-dependent protein
MRKYLFVCGLLLAAFAQAQNVGIGVLAPAEKLDVNGNIKATNLLIVGASGSAGDFLIRNSSGTLSTRKGHGAVAINFIIALVGIFPPQGGGGGSYTEQILGEIRMFAGTFAPSGFAFCNGQLLSISTNSALFSLLGTTYGGNGVTTFALPDLRAAAPVHFGTTANGTYSWTQGQKAQ